MMFSHRHFLSFQSIQTMNCSALVNLSGESVIRSQPTVGEAYLCLDSEPKVIIWPKVDDETVLHQETTWYQETFWWPFGIIGVVAIAAVAAMWTKKGISAFKREVDWMARPDDVESDLEDDKNSSRLALVP